MRLERDDAEILDAGEYQCACVGIEIAEPFIGASVRCRTSNPSSQIRLVSKVHPPIQ